MCHNFEHVVSVYVGFLVLHEVVDILEDCHVLEQVAPICEGFLVLGKVASTLGGMSHYSLKDCPTIWKFPYTTEGCPYT